MITVDGNRGLALAVYLATQLGECGIPQALVPAPLECHLAIGLRGPAPLSTPVASGVDKPLDSEIITHIGSDGGK